MADDIETKVAFLSSPASYPFAGSQVRVKETRTSWVFVTAGEVYKLKKPIKDRLVDFTSVESRFRNATEEVRLNRRLAPDVYLGVERLCRMPDGSLRLGGLDGEVVDWIVVMRRLADDGFLDQALARGAVSREKIEALATVLVTFYATAKPVKLSPERSPPAFVGKFSQLLREILPNPRLHVSRRRACRITGALLHAVANRGPVRRRAAAAPMVEGHGDLRPEHIWLNGSPVAIDCLEFDETLRIVDPLDELTFLSLECGLLGAPWVGRILLKSAKRMPGAHSGAELLDFYRCFRATLRASLALRHFLEPQRRKPGPWRIQARHYLDVADVAARGLRVHSVPNTRS